jgi:predicted enzyme related to lactoylglutathione lyase
VILKPKDHAMKLAEVQTFVSDLARARLFYESVLGLQIKQTENIGEFVDHP